MCPSCASSARQQRTGKSCPAATTASPLQAAQAAATDGPSISSQSLETEPWHTGLAIHAMHAMPSGSQHRCWCAELISCDSPVELNVMAYKPVVSCLLCYRYLRTISSSVAIIPPVNCLCCCFCSHLHTWLAAITRLGVSAVPPVCILLRVT